MSYVNDLQSAWNRYVTMSSGDVIQITTVGSPAYEPDFAAALGIIYSKRMFGFGNYGPAAGSNSFPGGGSGWNGPTRS
jgi:hypothetical protein